MGTYLVAAESDEIVSGSTSLTHTVKNLTQVFQNQAREERRLRLQAEYNARQAARQKARQKEIMYGYGSDGPSDWLSERIEYADGYILAAAFKMADEQLPWSVHLLPHVGMDVTRLNPEAYAKLVYWFDDARGIIHRMALENETCILG